MVCKLKYVLSVLACINFMHHDVSMAKCDNGYWSRDYQYSNNVKPQAEETEVRSTLFRCVKHSHSSCYVERCAAPAVALRYQLTLYK